jgi:hypothetical protein
VEHQTQGMLDRVIGLKAWEMLGELVPGIDRNRDFIAREDWEGMGRKAIDKLRAVASSISPPSKEEAPAVIETVFLASLLVRVMDANRHKNIIRIHGEQPLTFRVTQAFIWLVAVPMILKREPSLVRGIEFVAESSACYLRASLSPLGQRVVIDFPNWPIRERENVAKLALQLSQLAMGYSHDIPDYLLSVISVCGSSDGWESLHKEAFDVAHPVQIEESMAS